MITVETEWSTWWQCYVSLQCVGFGVERTNLTIPVNLMVKVDNENRLIYEVFCPYFTFISSLITLTIATSECFSRYLISFFVRNSISSRQTLLFTNLIGFFYFFLQNSISLRQTFTNLQEWNSKNGKESMGLCEIRLLKKRHPLNLSKHVL